MKKSLAGTAKDAQDLQRQNSVQEELCGPWYHGTADDQLQLLANTGAEKTYLTRSEGGGKPGSTYLLTVYVIKSLTDFKFVTPGAGDDGAIDPEDPRKRREDWWIEMASDEVDRLMVVGNQPLSPPPSASEIAAEQDESRQDSFLDALLDSEWAKKAQGESQAPSDGDGNDQ